MVRHNEKERRLQRRKNHLYRRKETRAGTQESTRVLSLHRQEGGDGDSSHGENTCEDS